jgi:hypothetical protein
MVSFVLRILKIALWTSGYIFLIPMVNWDPSVGMVLDALSSLLTPRVFSWGIVVVLKRLMAYIKVY